MTKRAGRKKDGNNEDANNGAGRSRVIRTVFDGARKREVGVSDLTLISKISDEAINDNLKKRFENAEIYVCIGTTKIWRWRKTPD